MRWRGPVGPALIAHLAGTNSTALATLADPRAWALDVLGFPPGTATPSKKEVTAQFRTKMRSVHPDHGGDQSVASTAVFELAEARKILIDRTADAVADGARRRGDTLLLFPGAGAGRDQSTLVAVERAVAPAWATVRADFPYRKEGRKAPDRPAQAAGRRARRARRHRRRRDRRRRPLDGRADLLDGRRRRRRRAPPGAWPASC